jgi:hypothetical protein
VPLRTIIIRWNLALSSLLCAKRVVGIVSVEVSTVHFDSSPKKGFQEGLVGFGNMHQQKWVAHIQVGDSILKNLHLEVVDRRRHY